MAVLTLDGPGPGADGEPDRATSTRELLSAMAACSDDAERHRIADEVVTVNLGIADGLAARYAGRGIPSEDLVQVARLALVRVVQGYDDTRGCDFLAYAVPSIRGALKRHFRDVGWTVRPPRRVQEAQLMLNAARAELMQQLGREPTVREAAEAIGVDEDTVIEALAADTCYTPDSLDRPVDIGGDGAVTVGCCLGGDDPGFELSEERTLLAPLLEALPARDRRVLELRFVHGLTQSEVGRQIGVSQMQVSRILSRVLGRLREDLEPSVPD